MQNHKAMKYFSGSTFQRLPLYKLALGGIAVLLCASLGVSVMATTFVPASGSQPSVPTMRPVATRETATPAPTPTATPTPLMEVRSEVTVVQQDVGVQLYYQPLAQTQAGTTAEEEDAAEGTAAVNVATAEGETGTEQDGMLPLMGVELEITLTDAQGQAESYPVDPDTGSMLAQDVQPGDYEISFPEVEGYHMPAPVSITVNEKIEYKPDVEAVKDKIVQADQVVESQEDSSYGGDTVVVDEIVDTVAYADPSRTEVSRTTIYTAQLSGDGYLLLTDGTVTAYRPVYDDAGLLTGARREASALNLAAGAALRSFGIGGLLRHGNNVPETPAEQSPDAQTAVEPLTEQPADPAPEAEATPVPQNDPAVETEPTPAPVDPTAGWPDEISAPELAGYGFAVSSQDQVTYQYTGWQTIGGVQYYYDPSTHQPVTGSQVIQGNVYEFAADGSLNQTSRGIDVSKYQGNIDWNAVAADGISFAIIRVGYRGYGSGALVEDSTFRQNIAGATAAGLKVGVYFYSQAINEAEAVEEASMVVSLCSGYSLPMGVYYDTEKVAGDTGRADGLSAAERTACAVAFCETIQNAGYTAGVYSYAGWFYNSLNFANISKYRIWIAQYRDTLDFSYRYDMWQYTSSGQVDGVPGGVDMNIG